MVTDSQIFRHSLSTWLHGLPLHLLFGIVAFSPAVALVAWTLSGDLTAESVEATRQGLLFAPFLLAPIVAGLVVPSVRMANDERRVLRLRTIWRTANSAMPSVAAGGAVMTMIAVGVLWSNLSIHEMYGPPNYLRAGPSRKLPAGYWIRLVWGLTAFAAPFFVSWAVPIMAGSKARVIDAFRRSLVFIKGYFPLAVSLFGLGFFAIFSIDWLMEVLAFGLTAGDTHRNSVSAYLIALVSVDAVFTSFLGVVIAVTYDEIC
jgi:hypothetical protein